jgi:hypothetical protein
MYIADGPGMGRLVRGPRDLMLSISIFLGLIMTTAVTIMWLGGLVRYLAVFDILIRVVCGGGACESITYGVRMLPC